MAKSRKAQDPEGETEDPAFQRKADVLIKRPIPRRGAKGRMARKAVLDAKALEDAQRLTVDPDAVDGGGRTLTDRSPLERAQIRMAVLKLSLLKHGAEDIAAKLNLPRATVDGILRDANRVYKTVARETVLNVRGRQALLLDSLIDEAIQAWEASKAPRVTRTVEVIPPGRQGTGTGRTGKVTERTEPRNPDPRYLDTVTGLLSRQAKTLGTDAPVDLRMVLEVQDEGQRRILASLKKHIKDPELIRAIAQDMMQDEDGSTGPDTFEEEND